VKQTLIFKRYFLTSEINVASPGAWSQYGVNKNKKGHHNGGADLGKMQEKADSELVRRQNRRVVLNALRQHGPLARIELGRATGLSPASITSIASQLIAEHILEELEAPFPLAASTRRGRPIVRLGITSSAAHVLAVNISIDAVRFAISNFNGEIQHRTELHIPTYPATAQKFGEDVADAIAAFLKASGFSARAISRIGIAVQGLADDKEGTLVWSPAFSSKDIPLTEPIEQRFGIPCLLANDANMIAEGLLSENPARSRGTTATIFTGYGVGMGLIIDGKVYHGATGGASEFGHMNHIPHGAPCRCGRRGCIEAYAADYGIWREANGARDDDAPHEAIDAELMKALLDRAMAGEVRAVQAFEKAGEALGIGIARLIAILNPDRIVIAGPGLNASQIIEPSLQRGVVAGVIEELRRNVSIEFVPFETDMILRGTIAALLRAVDGDITAQGLAGRGETVLDLSQHDRPANAPA
jgi:predicted NBD/HSP70 family sugar kinase